MSAIADSVAAFVGILKERKLLEPEQLAELTPEVLGKVSDPRLLAKQLIQKGWLTAYQVNQVLTRNGQDLVLGSYILLERLGEGGMGQVFKAKHNRMDRVVALKVVRKEHLSNPTAVKRFRREIQAASQLSHPNIVNAFDANEVGETHFLVMEYVDGIDLVRLVKEQGPLPVGEACDYIRQAALGLQHAFERGLVHRDIKPANLLVTRAKPGDKPTLKILDMGLARLEDPSPTTPELNNLTQLTQDGRVVGTPDYMAPEQARNSHTSDIRADLYSLGCTLYYLLTGKVLFPGGTGMEKLLKHQMDEPPSLAKSRKDVPQGVQKIVKKLLAKKPAERFQTPGELVAALEPFCRTPARISGARAKKPKTAVPAMAAGATLEQVAVGSPAVSPQVSRSNQQRRWLLVGAAGGAVQAAIVLLIGLVLAQPGGSGSLPPDDSGSGGTKTGSVGTPKIVTGIPKPKLIEVPVPGRPLLDQLDASRIPAAERVEGQPEELVAVLGEHHRRGWTPVRNLAIRFEQPPSIVSIGDDHVVRRWDISNLSEQTTLRGPQAPNVRTALALGGRLAAFVVVPEKGGTRIGLMETEFGQRLRAEPANPPDIIHNLTFSLDGKRLAVTGQERRDGPYLYRVWSTETGQEIATYTCEQVSTIFGVVALSGDGREIAWVENRREVGADGGARTIQLVRVAAPGARQDRQVLRNPGNSYIGTLVYAPNQQTLAAAAGSELILWDLATGESRTREPIRAHADLITALAFTFESGLLVSGCRDGTLRRWDAASGEGRGGFSGSHLLGVNALAVSIDDRTLVSGGADQSLRVWDLSSGRERVTADPAYPVTALTFGADGRFLAAGTRERAGQLVKVWNLADGRETITVREKSGQIGNQISFSPDGKSLATTCWLPEPVKGQRGFVRLWDSESGQIKGNFGTHLSLATCLAFSPDSNLLAVGTSFGAVRLWDLKENSERNPHPVSKGRAAFLGFSDKRTLLAGGSAYEGGKSAFIVKTWDLPGQQERILARGNVLGGTLQGAVSADGRVIAATAFESEGNRWGLALKLFDAASGNERATVHPTGLQTLALSADGQLLATIGRESYRVNLWETTTGRHLRDFDLPGPVHSLAFADNRHLATGNGNGTIYILRVR